MNEVFACFDTRGDGRLDPASARNAAFLLVGQAVDFEKSVDFETFSEALAPREKRLAPRTFAALLPLSERRSRRVPVDRLREVLKTVGYDLTLSQARQLTSYISLTADDTSLTEDDLTDFYRQRRKAKKKT